MLLSGESLSNPAMTRVGLESLTWLADLQRSDTASRHFVPSGSNSFYQQDGERARFDQQPVEAQAMVSACLEAAGSPEKKLAQGRPPRWSAF
jgi:hypothetical protein